jgi:hypothetical protein
MYVRSRTRRPVRPIRAVATPPLGRTRALARIRPIRAGHELKSRRRLAALVPYPAGFAGRGVVVGVSPAMTRDTGSCEYGGVTVCGATGFSDQSCRS